MTIDATTDQALREQIAQAIHRASCSCEGHGELPSWYRRAADAVLPIVQAHQQKLADVITELQKRDEVATRVITHRREESRVLRVEKARALTDLSSLRSAVARLADQLDREAERDDKSLPADATPEIERDETLRYAARRLRSLLPQEGQK